MSRVTAIISAFWLSASSSCLFLWAVNHYRDNAITYKAQRDKNARELKLANATVLTCRCVSVMLLRSIKIHEEDSLMLKLKMMLCVMMLPLVVVGCTSKQSVSQCVKPPPPAWIMQPPPDWRGPLNGIIAPQRLITHYAKTTGRNPGLLMSSANGVARIVRRSATNIVSNTHALPAEYKCLK